MNSNVFGTLDEISAGIEALRRELGALHGLFGGSGARISKRRGRKAKPSAKKEGNKFRRARKTTAPARKPRRAVSAKVKARQKLQGRYLAAMSKLNVTQRKQVKGVLEAKGIHAALAKADNLKK